MSRDSLERAQAQARLQVASEDAGTIRFRLLEPERDADGALVPNRGLLALPEPVDGDLFFDIEGARYYSEDGREFGLQYLFGVVDTADLDEAGRPRYTPIWAFDRRGEKRAFEELVDFITERRDAHARVARLPLQPLRADVGRPSDRAARHPAGGGGRLMGRFATREDEVDDLFRLGVFVDLYKVVRQGVRAGVESYSIKRLEPLCGYRRQVDLREATASLIGFEAALEDGTAAGDAGRQRVSPDTTRTTAGRPWPCVTGWRSGALIWPRGWAQELPRPVADEEAARPRTRRSPGSGTRCLMASRPSRRRAQRAAARRRCWPT